MLYNLDILQKLGLTEEQIGGWPFMKLNFQMIRAKLTLALQPRNKLQVPWI